MNFLKRRIARVVLALGLAAITVGCAPQNPASTSTPAPPQSTDLTIARALDDAQASINKAKEEFGANASAKEPLNKIIAAYNTARSGFIAYRSATAGAPSLAQLQAQTDKLKADIAALIQLFRSN